MILTVLGLLLLFCPFFLLGFFVDKTRGFIYILFFVFIFQFILGFILQIFNIFYYEFILLANLLIFLAIIIYYFKNKKKYYFKDIRIDWILILVVAIVFLNLFQVHYSYTGKISLVSDQIGAYTEVKNMSYIYPYFSDEWYAVSFIKGAINFNSLPIRNVFNNGYITNLEVFFHSFLSEIFLLLKINPLTSYVFVSLIFNILLVVLTYLFFRINNINKIISGISSLLIIYISCGANLPGIWNLLPVSFGLMFTIFSFLFVEFKDFKASILASFFTVLFYPPFIFFSILGFLFYSLFKFRNFIENNIKPIIFSFLCAILFFAILYIFLIEIPLVKNFISLVLTRFFYFSYSGLNVPQYSFYYVIPFFAAVLFVIGIFIVFKTKKWIFVQAFFGIFLWILYSVNNYRIIIEYDKTVYFTSFLILIISGFALDFLAKKFDSKFLFSRLVGVISLIIFLLIFPFYTKMSNWEKFILVDKRNNMISLPKAPANNYLTKEDLRIFENINNKTFLSLPWKGTAIGVATNNYPLVTKEGTISMGQETLPRDFYRDDCQKKQEIAKNLKIDYVYLYEFDCPGFVKIDKSKEDLYLYEFKYN